MAFVIDLRAGETVLIPALARMTVLEKSGQRARLSFIVEGDGKIQKVQSNSTGATQARHGLKLASG